MQIHESDLGRGAALAASKKLQDMVQRGRLGGEFQFGVMNQLKIIRGHVLLHQAHSDRKEFGPASLEARESTQVFCKWLGTEGFWYD
ncbi:hypothetical protein GCM10023332_11410 [Luteimonas vadosa]|uniref:Uncharacterized protein n=2 Tax=Luteimonas vadosa TaxID=1165507 RepID=A0ABP9DVB0_9GAMM